MPNPTIKTFEQIVSDTVTAIQASANQLIDFAIGSIMRAMAESNTVLVLWIQGILLELLAAIRAATCVGADLDSWCEDYGFYRFPAEAASGLVTFARFTSTQAAFIPVGTQVQTYDATSQLFEVVADTGNAAYDATLGGYTINAGVGSLQVPVSALAAGAAGNILAGQLNILKDSVPGVDTVTNANAFTNGADAEDDDSFRARFVLYITTLSKATKSAIGSAILAVQQGITYTLTENESYAGTAQLGYFYVVVDDGTGTPTGGFLAAINNAVDAVRPFTSTFGVYAPVVVSANIAMTITTDPNYVHGDVVAEVETALNAYISGLALGADLPYSRLAQIAYDSSDGVTNVTGVTLNAGTADLAATNKQVIKPGTISVT
jgi:uncharacterized phage protein gp47/JayE